MNRPDQLEIKDDDYRVYYQPETQSVTFAGELQLSSMDEYHPIMKLLDQVVNQEPDILTLDLRKLEFLNSSGINILLRLVIKVREKATTQLVVKGAERVPWQTQSLQNLRRLMPSLQLQLE